MSLAKIARERCCVLVGHCPPISLPGRRLADPGYCAPELLFLALWLACFVEIPWDYGHILSCFFFIFVYLWGSASQHACGDQRTTCRSHLLPSTINNSVGSGGSNSAHQAWRQELSPTEPSCWPHLSIHRQFFCCYYGLFILCFSETGSHDGTQAGLECSM